MDAWLFIVLIVAVLFIVDLMVQRLFRKLDRRVDRYMDNRTPCICREYPGDEKLCPKHPCRCVIRSSGSHELDALMLVSGTLIDPALCERHRVTLDKWKEDSYDWPS